MNELHKIAIYMPALIVWYWLFCAVFLIDTKFYYNNFELLDWLDTITVLVSTIHFIFFRQMYGNFSKMYLQCMYAIVILNFAYFCLNEYFYFILYYSITITYIILSFWKITLTRKS